MVFLVEQSQWVLCSK